MNMRGTPKLLAPVAAGFEHLIGIKAFVGRSE
jgi:hypothetical protein